MLESFRANMEVLWGFLLALAVVLVLTPGVGRIGRVLGIVDEPGERRRLPVRPVPRPGGIARFLRLLLPPLAFHDLSPWIGVPATLLWIVALMNMVNFLDGLDGLAAGIAAISGGTFAVIALSLGKPEAAVLSAAFAGGCLGFLRHN